MPKAISLVVLLLLLNAATAADEALEPWCSNRHPTDVSKSHIEECSTGAHRYMVLQGGTMDGRNCRSPMGCGMSREGAFLQTWESNRSVRMENVGQTDVVNPWLSNGRNNFRTVGEIVSRALLPDMTDGEKAFALWFQQIQHRHHNEGDNDELGDPVKVFNVYGYNTCGNDSICLGTLWQAAGLRTAPARVLGHCVTQAFYDGRWHLFDGDLHSVYLLRDNQTVAGEQDIVRDHDLVKRTHSQGILLRDDPRTAQGTASMYFFEGAVSGARAGRADSSMNMVLRPGEAIEWRWGRLTPVKHHGRPGANPVYPNAICNGLWEYRPDFSNDLWRRGATNITNIRTTEDGLVSAKESGAIVWKIRSPYAFVGGRLELTGKGIECFFARDGAAWKPVSFAAGPSGGNVLSGDLDHLFSSAEPACYEFFLQCRLSGGGQLRSLAVSSDIQMAPLALPEMVVGPNAFAYTDQSEGERRVRITHKWVERSASRPPAASSGAVNPPDGGSSNGLDVVFQWAPAQDPDRDAIADYHFELSSRADMRWPLSMSFYKLLSRTIDNADEISPKFAVSHPGLLAPGQTYYWRVRAKDANGVWGPWSATWRFTAEGPAHPVNVAIDWDSTREVATLRWQANRAGRPPVRFRIYGSHEKGFTISDAPYQTSVGISKEVSPTFPANFIAETTETHLDVLGPAIDLPNANKTHYRVVAVDDQGKRSGASDYATAPRPIIYSRPVRAAKVGAEYHYQVQATRSLGDLSSRMVAGRQIQNFWDVEKPKYSLDRKPDWLTIDEATGMLHGTPTARGEVEVVVTATIDRKVRRLDEPTLKWGNEKVLEESTERVGQARQSFVIAIR